MADTEGAGISATPAEELRAAAKAVRERAQAATEPSLFASTGSVRDEFVRLLTTDSPHHDRRRRDFNQALFMLPDGKPVWSETTLDMVLAKFDKAVRNLRRGTGDPR